MITDEEKKRIYSANCERMGAYGLMHKTVEEMNEACAAIMQQHNKQHHSKRWDAVLKEIADVEIMLEQFVLSINQESIDRLDEHKQNKLQRLKQRLGL